MPTYIENQRRIDADEFTNEECERYGATHAAYQWAATPPGHWSDAHKAAYRRGYDRERKRGRERGG